MSTPVLQVRNLRVELAGSGADVIDKISFSVERGRVLGLVGESGCGKSTTAIALLGHARSGVRIAGGEVLIEGRNLLKLDTQQARGIRGRLVSYVPQDPPASLNPALRIRTQLNETLTAHGRRVSRTERQARLAEVLAEVGLPGTDDFLSRYSHQLSGGQQQRVVLAMAFMGRPGVIVLDEPTTGLDVTIQSRVLSTIRELCVSHGTGAVFVSHDMAVIGSIADDVAVMYSGRIVELGPKGEVLTSPAHPYTKKLVRAMPDLNQRRALVGIPGRAPSPRDRPAGCNFAPRCDDALEQCTEGSGVVRLSSEHMVRCWRAAALKVTPASDGNSAAHLPTRKMARRLLSVHALSGAYSGVRVLHDIDLEVKTGECLSIVGESGSGKTTLAQCISGLHDEFSGVISFQDRPLARNAYARPPSTRRAIQYIFQNPYGSLNPRKTVGRNIAQPIAVLEKLGYGSAHTRIAEVLEDVGLAASLMNSYPEHLSGGERQRVAIARALIVEPKLLICDEITSSLDVSVQATIIELLRTLQRGSGMTMVFVTHNLALTRSIADRVVVMKEGRIVEVGATENVLSSPESAYTRQLLRDAPRFVAEGGDVFEGRGV